MAGDTITGEQSQRDGVFVRGTVTGRESRPYVDRDGVKQESITLGVLVGMDVVKIESNEEDASVKFAKFADGARVTVPVRVVGDWDKAANRAGQVRYRLGK